MSESKKEYYLDTYKKEAKATIVEIKGEKIYLDKTIFYPEGGGQPGDIGYIENVEVLDTQKDGFEITHIVSDSSSLVVGQTVYIKLDWEHRYSYMKMHTAQHLISGILHSFFNVATVSVHQGSKFLSIEIDKSNFSEQDCFKVEDIANKKIIESLPITYLEMEKNEAEKLLLRRSIKVDGLIRIVKIENSDLIACGGLHVANTSEIERVMFCGTERIRKHYRLLFKVGEQAIQACRYNDKIIKELCVLHSATVDTLIDCEKSLIEKNLECEKQLRLVKKENANLVLSAMLEKNSSDIITYDITEYNIDFKDIELNQDKAIFLYKRENDIIKWYIYLGESFKDFNIKNIRENVLSIIDGKGGGKYPTFQGKGTCENIDKCVKAFVGYFNERRK